MKNKTYSVAITDRELRKIVGSFFSEQEINKNEKLLNKTINGYVGNLKRFILDKISHELCSLNIQRVGED